jgi:ATP-binding cassette subfamily C (CFTR/MRP) protein 1
LVFGAVTAVRVLAVISSSHLLITVTHSSSSFTHAQHLHDRLINSVMNAPTGWFDATPVGRIVNRFSQDMSTVVSCIKFVVGCPACADADMCCVLLCVWP